MKISTILWVAATMVAATSTVEGISFKKTTAVPKLNMDTNIVPTYKAVTSNAEELINRKIRLKRVETRWKLFAKRDIKAANKIKNSATRAEVKAKITKYYNDVALACLKKQNLKAKYNKKAFKSAMNAVYKCMHPGDKVSDSADVGSDDSADPSPEEKNESGDPNSDGNDDDDDDDDNELLSSSEPEPNLVNETPVEDTAEEFVNGESESDSTNQQDEIMTSGADTGYEPSIDKTPVQEMTPTIDEAPVQEMTPEEHFPPIDEAPVQEFTPEESHIVGGPGSYPTSQHQEYMTGGAGTGYEPSIDETPVQEMTPTIDEAPVQEMTPEEHFPPIDEAPVQEFTPEESHIVGGPGSYPTSEHQEYATEGITSTNHAGFGNDMVWPFSPASPEVPPFWALDLDHSNTVDHGEWQKYLEHLKMIAMEAAGSGHDAVGVALLKTIIDFHYGAFGSCLARKFHEDNIGVLHGEDADAFNGLSDWIETNCYVKFRYSLFAGSPPFEWIAKDQPTVAANEIEAWFTDKVNTARVDLHVKQVVLISPDHEELVEKFIGCTYATLQNAGDVAVDRDTFYAAGKQIEECATK